VGNSQEGVLIDAGISCRETEKRMKQLGLRLDTVKAIFISHEHGDHIRGLEGLTAKHYIPVYITPATLKYSHLKLHIGHVHHFLPHQPVTIGGLTVLAFPKLHDAIAPHSSIVQGDGVNVGVFTDIGEPCEQVISYFKQCHAVFLEANYDEQMLFNGHYGQRLISRIHGRYGHLSNLQAYELFSQYRPAHMRHVFLSHLSKQNNDPAIALALFDGFAEHTAISIASRYAPSGVFTIETGGVIEPTPTARAVQTVLW